MSGTGVLLFRSAAGSDCRFQAEAANRPIAYKPEAQASESLILSLARVRVRSATLHALPILCFDHINHGRFKLCFVIEPTTTLSLGPESRPARHNGFQSASAPCLELFSSRFRRITARADDEMDVVCPDAHRVKCSIANHTMTSKRLLHRQSR